MANDMIVEMSAENLTKLVTKLEKEVAYYKNELDKTEDLLLRKVLENNRLQGLLVDIRHITDK